MATTKVKGNEVQTTGDLPKVGSKAPAFTLVAGDLSEKSLSDFAGKTVVLTVNPSLDTGTCQVTARQFNKDLEGRDDVVVLVVTADLPFAQKRFCEADGIKNAIPLSTFRSSFGKDYGVELASGGLKGLTARAVIVIDAAGVVKYTEIAPELTEVPNFAAALAAL